MTDSNNSANNSILVAYDYSGSTGGSRFYHTTVQTVLSNISDYKVVLWDHSIKESTPAELKRINDSLRGNGGTSPIQVAQYCYTKHITGQLILITDGQIPDYEVKNLDAYLAQHPLSLTNLDCYIISSDSYSKLDATVIAPFLARFPHKVTLFKEDEGPLVLASNNASYEEFIEQLRSINTIEEFISKYEELFSGVISKMLGKTEDATIRDEILQIQKRLLQQMRQTPEGFKMETFLQACESHNVKQMVQLAKSLNLKFYRNFPSPEWPAMIFHLLRMCSGNLNSVYSLAALGSRFNPDRVHRADVVKNFKVTSVHITDKIDSPSFVCPISYQEEQDFVVLIKKPDKALLSDLGKPVVLTSNSVSPETNKETSEMLDEIMGNPLSAIRYPDFISKLIECIDHPISLRSMKEAEEAKLPITISPITRAPIIGGLCLGPTAEHVSATNWAIAQLTADGKHVGHSDLWFALIWYLVSIGKIPYLTPYLPQFTEHMKWRLKNSKAAATLSTIPYYCMTEVPLGAAVWFTLSLSEICAKEEQATEILSTHVSHFEILKKLLELTGYPLPDGVPEYLSKFEAKAIILKFIQQNDRNQLNSIIASAFSYVQNGNEFIPIDGDPSQEQVEKALDTLPTFFREMTPEYRRASAVLAQTSADKANLNILGQKFETINWIYGTKDVEIPPVEICPATGRPYMNVPPQLKKWYELSEQIYGPLSEQIHIHFMYIEYVRENKKFPNKEEFLSYVYHTIVPSQKATLPRLILMFVENVINGYDAMFAKRKLTPKEFIKLVHITASRTRRAEIEEKGEMIDLGKKDQAKGNKKAGKKGGKKWKKHH